MQVLSANETVDQGIQMSEVFIELSSNTSNAQARRSSGVGTSKEERKLKEHN